jgi:hypothetical protein
MAGLALQVPRIPPQGVSNSLTGPSVVEEVRSGPFDNIITDHEDADRFDCYEVLEIFFFRCQGIRNLRLEWFVFWR